MSAEKNKGIPEAPRDSSVFIPAARSLWRQFGADARAMPREVWRRFLARLAVGYVWALGVGAAVMMVGRWAAPRGMHAWDERALHWLAEEHPPFSFYQATILESPGNIAGVLPVLVLTVIIAIRRGAPLVAVGYAAGYGLARVLVLASAYLWDRPRPNFIAEGIASPTFHSYPSGHAVFATFVYGYLAWLWCRASRSPLERTLAVLLTAILLCVITTARLVLGTHWPSDVLAGFIIGGTWLAGVAWAVTSESRL